MIDFVTVRTDHKASWENIYREPLGRQGGLMVRMLIFYQAA